MIVPGSHIYVWQGIPVVYVYWYGNHFRHQISSTSADQWFKCALPTAQTCFCSFCFCWSVGRCISDPDETVAPKSKFDCGCLHVRARSWIVSLIPLFCISNPVSTNRFVVLLVLESSEAALTQDTAPCSQHIGGFVCSLVHLPLGYASTRIRQLWTFLKELSCIRAQIHWIRPKP